MTDIFNIQNYDYEVPEELIAQRPLENRDESKLLVLDKDTGEIRHTMFNMIKDELRPGDCLVLNNTKVIPARLYGRTERTGAAIEALLLKSDGILWQVMMKNSKRTKPGDSIIFSDELKAEVFEKNGKIVKLKFNCSDNELNEQLWNIGVMPLPPYIKESIRDEKHRNIYQTVFAKNEGAKAAPTAGFHFTEKLFSEIKNKGVLTAELTLHVGLGTFEPVDQTDIRDHKMHSEWYSLDEENSSIINSAKGRVIAVGTTALRTLESIAGKYKTIKADSGETDIYIYPGYEFKAIDALITNFHLPKTTLLALVYAFAGAENIMKAYQEAISKQYRLFSYGDAMFIR